MKIRIISLTLAFATLFIFCSASVFASEDEIDYAELYAALEDAGVSTSDVISESDVVSPSDHISNYSMYRFKIKQHRLSMLIPELSDGFSANSTNTELSQKYPDYGYSVEDLLNYNDSYYSGNVLSYLLSSSSSDGSIMVTILYTANNYTNFIGSYSAIDSERLEDIRASATSFTGESPEIRKINGNTYLFSSGDDAEYGYYSYSLETVVGGGRYQIYIDLSDPSPADLAVATEMIRSIKIGGLRSSLSGAADKSLVTAMLIALIVLFAAVCLLAFFIIRFSKFASAAGSKFNIIGFNMPPKKSKLEKYNKDAARTDRKKKVSGAQNTPASQLDRTVSLSDSIADDE